MGRHLVNKTIEWLGRNELRVLIGLLVVVAGSLTFILVADRVTDGTTQRIDEAILRSMRTADDPAVPRGPKWLKGVILDLTALGGYAVLTIVTVCVGVYLYFEDRRSTMRFVLASIIGGFVLSLMLKSTFERPRPTVVPHLAVVHHSSFPSGHSMMSAVVYLTLGSLLARFHRNPRIKFFFLIVPILLSLLIGLSRVFAGVHYPTDVLAGWSAGLAWATLCWLTARQLQRRGQLAVNGQNSSPALAGSTASRP